KAQSSRSRSPVSRFRLPLSPSNSPSGDSYTVERMAPVSEFVRSLPKAELHLHLEGTVEPETLLELADRHPEPFEPPPNSRYKDVSQVDLLAPGTVEHLYQYEDFRGFLNAFKAVSEQMRAPEDFELVAYKMIERLHSEGVRYAEVYVS